MIVAPAILGLPGFCVLALFSGRFEFSDAVPAVVGVMFLVVWVVLMWRQRNRQDQGSLPESPREARKGGPAGDVKRDLEELAAEIEQLTTRLAGDFEQRCTRLEKLMQEADKRIGELRRLTGEDPPPTERSQASGVSPWAVKPATARPAWGATSSEVNAPEPAPAPVPAPGAVEDPVARSVYALADAGHAPLEIARRLQEHVGKVELILALRRE